MIRQNPLFSGLYMAGTALAICVTLIMSIAYYVQLAPIYPEYNRGNTYYMSSCEYQKGNSSYSWSFSHNAMTDLLYPLKNKEVVSGELVQYIKNYVQPDNNSGDIEVTRKLVDPQFFKVYNFKFLEGKPFTMSDLNSRIRNAVITDELAQILFGTKENVIGKTFKLDYTDTKVCGVVKSASSLTKNSYAQIYIPYTTDNSYEENKQGMNYLGCFTATIVVKNNAQAKALRKEITEIVRKLNASDKDSLKIVIWNQPTSHYLKAFQSFPSDTDISIGSTLRYFALILLVLLIVPAVNLSGMISSRMEERLPEMGVRKSFGANRRGLLSQVLWENLILTIIGGIIGIILAWILIYVDKAWIFSLFDKQSVGVAQSFDVEVSGEMLFAPIVFIIAFTLCLVLNLLSALIPAWFSLRKPIVYSIKEKD